MGQMSFTSTKSRQAVRVHGTSLVIKMGME